MSAAMLMAMTGPAHGEGSGSWSEPSLLPAVRGSLRHRVPLAERSWFRVGGPAEIMFEPADAEDLGRFLAQRPAGLPVTILGLASNLILRDGGVPGATIRLPRSFAGIELDGDCLTVGAAAADARVARAAQEAGLAGLEFLCGIPGSIGGAVRMNAGAYGTEISDILIWAEVMDPAGRRHRLGLDDLDFGYRRCALPDGWIVLAARLRGRPDDTVAIGARMTRIRTEREISQPVRARTGGSTFANPPGAQRAWQLIDAAGCRGLRRGGAQVSRQHCNFLINTGNATAADLEDLGEEVRARVAAQSGVQLRWEIRRIGLRGGCR
ncbi:MAG: UDP-N-acetylmuramate dehydrogenase [Sneathiellaceae bacterium]